MIRRKFAILLIFLLCFSAFQIIDDFENCKAAVLPKFFVDDDYDSSTPGWQVDHFDTIQDAIDSPNCTNGDRIIVYQGTYNENVVIDKGIDLFGEDRDNTIIDGETGTNIIITSENVDISSFTIKDSSSESDICIDIRADNCKIIDNIIKSCDIGIFVNNSNNVTIAYNSITGNSQGIFGSSSSYNTIDKNKIYSNNKNGIYLNDTCNRNVISENNIYSNTYNGVFLQNHCNNNNLSENRIYSNSKTGIRIDNCSSNMIYRNSRIDANSNYGIMIAGSENEAYGNTISDNDFHGIFLIADDHSVVEKNTIRENTYEGIRIHNSTNNIVKENRIISNSRYGVHINYYAVGNRIFNNYFYENLYNARDISQQVNFWNKTKTSGSNILKGPYIGGNYWDDYSGNDTNGDGIGDENYQINGNTSLDYLPLMYQLPTADTGGPYSASTGESISFDGSESVSPDGNITSYLWEYGDGTTGSGSKPSHTYSEAGTYSVNLTIYNDLGGSDTDSTTATITDDTSSPTITVNQRGESGDLSNLFTFSAYVTDNVGIVNVWIEYWYGSSDNKMTANMENTAGDLYKKVITTQQSTEKIYCVIYANDTSGNIANTKSPKADIGGPYSNNQVLEEITFDASDSYDLDGNITSYEWVFGDGTTGNGKTIKHTYYTNDDYTVSLTVTDNDGKTGSDSISISISALSSTNSSVETMNLLENWSDTNLNKTFYAYDTDGNDKMDTFSDENGVFSSIKSEPFIIDSKTYFLISIDDDPEKVYLWCVDDDGIINVTYQTGTKTEDTVNKYSKQRTVKIQVNKADWTFIEVSDNYPNDEIIKILRSDNTIVSDNMIWRRSDKLYILDDPSTVYRIYYEYTPPPLDDAVFIPPAGSIIGSQNNTITISYSQPVEIVDAVFYNYITGDHVYIKDEIVAKDDNQTFEYTPYYDLKEGEYQLLMDVKSIEGGDSSEDIAVYKFVPYTPESQKIPIDKIIILFTILGGTAGALYFISRKLDINFESFVYFKNKKIIPFIKPFVLGPVRLKIEEDNIKKAEFYVNGKLNETVTEPPYTWDFDKTGIMRPKIEAKIYDSSGEESSTGKMTFYIFNNRLFR